MIQLFEIFEAVFEGQLNSNSMEKGQGNVCVMQEVGCVKLQSYK